MGEAIRKEDINGWTDGVCMVMRKSEVFFSLISSNFQEDFFSISSPPCQLTDSIGRRDKDSTGKGLTLTVTR